MNNDAIAQIGWQHCFEGDDVLQFGYISGFKEGADVMVDSASQNGTQDLLVFPIIFCYRQYIELVLKNILRKSYEQDKYLEIIGCCRHNLVNLLQCVKHTQLYKDKIYDPQCTIDNMVCYFDKIDRGSYNYRFPLDVKGNYSIDKVPPINISQLKITMQTLDNIVFQLYN